MTAKPFMQLYVADYLGDTRHLTTEQHGAYLLILMTMWRHGAALPNDPAKLARIAGVTLRRWHLVSPDVMAFFDVDGDTITQKRLVEEYQKGVSISEKRSASGKIGAASKSLKNKETAPANAKHLPQHSHIPDSYRAKRPPDGGLKKTRQEALAPSKFEAFWQAYPNKVGKPQALAAFVKASKRADHETVMAGLARYVSKTDDRPWCNPATWLNQDRWDDQPSAVAQSRGGAPPGRRTASHAAMEFAARAREARENRYGGLFGQNGEDQPDAGGAVCVIPGVLG